MRWPIRNQIFVPFATVLFAAAASIAVTAAMMAAHRSTRERIEQLNRVQATLADASFPYTENVLRTLRGLSGADFVALDKRGEVVLSTFDRDRRRTDLPRTLPDIGPPRQLDEFDTVEHAGIRYFAAALRGNGLRDVASILVLYPAQNLRQARWEAAWPPLAIGGVTMLVVVVISAWLSRRLARRIEAVRTLFSRVADGEFKQVPAERPVDEVYELVLSANRLSDQLAAMKEQVARTESLRLLAQLAGGFAHQFRNAVAGARMAVQIHQRRCLPSDGDDSLVVALRQLTLTEEQVRGLLSLGKSRAEPPIPGDLRTIVSDIEQLVRPASRHARVDLMCAPLPEDVNLHVANATSLRAGLLNLILNAIEAAGVGGRVRIWGDRDDNAIRLSISDSGTGPPDALQSSLFEPFVSSKPEGIGLGLVLAQSAAAEHGGAVSWTRIDGETVFTISLTGQYAGTAPSPPDLGSRPDFLRSNTVEISGIA